jgi:hypothetical protein
MLRHFPLESILHGLPSTQVSTITDLPAEAARVLRKQQTSGGPLWYT